MSNGSLMLNNHHACEQCLHIEIDVVRHSCAQRPVEYEAHSLHLLHYPTQEPAPYGWPGVQLKEGKKGLSAC